MIASSPRLIAERLGLRLVVVARPQPGCGDIISDPKSNRLIQGVEIEAIAQYPDERGCFSELFRFGEPGIGRDFVPAEGSRVQISYTISYPGIIKAIHYHFEQTDLWAPLSGMFQVLLYDLRESSPTSGSLATVYLGSMRPWRMRIPPGVAHGYKVIGTETGRLVYATNRFYNPADEGRIPFDDAGINYDWVTRPK